MIPKKIHYCWFGGGEMPAEYQEYIESWRKHCPDYEIIRWDESNYDITKNDYMREACENKKYGFVPDYARLDIIYNEGGIYLDTDIEIIKPLDELLELEAFCGEEKSSKYVALGLGFGAEKGNEIIRLMRDYYDDIHFIQNGKPNLLPSPEINTRPLYKLGFKYSDSIQQLEYKGSKLHIFPGKYFCPMDYETGEIDVKDETFSIHHYSGSWQSEESHKIRELSKKYSKKYGSTIGIKLAKLEYHAKNTGIKAVPVLFAQFIKNRITKICRIIKSKI